MSDRYRFGIIKSNAFHFHPLNFIKSLANENAQKGAKISEKAQLLHYEKYGKKFKLKVKFSTVLKDIFAERIVFATGGYAGSEIKDLRKYWLPIKTFIGVTERIDKKLTFSLDPKVYFVFFLIFLTVKLSNSSFVKLNT